MIDMLVFWLTYGAWFVFTWGLVFIIGLMLLDYLVTDITAGDYNLDYILERELPASNLVLGIFLGLGAILHLTVMLHTSLSYHDIAVKVAEFSSTHLTTSFGILLILGGLYFSTKKAYPKIKKIKKALDKLETVVDKDKD